jgi:hypothetical protein
VILHDDAAAGCFSALRAGRGQRGVALTHAMSFAAWERDCERQPVARKQAGRDAISNLSQSRLPWVLDGAVFGHIHSERRRTHGTEAPGHDEQERRLPQPV